MVIIREIDEQRKHDVCLSNDPFLMWGRMVPSFLNGKWNCTIEQWPKECWTEIVFPDANYDYEAMLPDYFFLGAYDGDKCVGLAVLKKHFFKYLYVEDLNIQKNYRRQGIGKKLMDASAALAVKKGYRGIYLHAQDNNLSACLFYQNAGFRIGGYDTELYRGTSQEGKADITFYKDAEPEFL